MKKLLICLSMLITTSGFADFTVNSEAGYLYGPAGTPLPTGSLLLLIAAGGDQTFSNTLVPGQFVSGNDIILGAAAVNDSGEQSPPSTGMASQNAFSVTLTPAPATGDYLALRWFTDVTFSEFMSGTLTAAGNTFGTYNPAMYPQNMGDLNPDGGDNWTAPGPGSLVNLVFNTTSYGGTQPDVEGFANFVVVPEPSTTLLGLAAAAGALVLRRRRPRR